MDIQLSFLGAAQNVTGSRYMVEVNGTKVLVECGLYQERPLLDRNWDPFPVPAKSIDAVLLTHAHLDHCGLLPKLVREGFRGQIHCTPATADIARIILLDAAHLQEEDAEYKLKRHRKEGRQPRREIRPLYRVADAERTNLYFQPHPYDQPVHIAPGVRATFCNAGHVLGASSILLEAGEGEEARSILFSGDIGRDDMPIVNNPSVPHAADYVLIESTYGDRKHLAQHDVAEELAKVIDSTVAAGGNLVIPSFALERSQDLLYHINELTMTGRLPELPVYLDSPMGIAITQVFTNHPELFDERMTRFTAQLHSPFELPGLRMTLTTNDSKAINRVKSGAIIIAGSGMCTGGRIKHHLVNNIMRPECTILFAGYQAAGTLGRQIADGAAEVRILGRLCMVKANIARIAGFSAHADRDELTRWVTGVSRPPREVFVVHGESGVTGQFRDHLARKTGWKVTAPAYNDRVMLK